MDAVTSQDEQALRAQLERARERLEGLAGELRSIDDELADLSGERKQYRLLHDACGALEELRELGAAALFWGERGGDEDRLRLARGRVDAFQKRIGEIEDRRSTVLEELERQQESSDLIAEDVFDLERQEEQRKLEWVVEREISALPARGSLMPWTHGGEDDRRLRRSLATALLLSLLLGLAIPHIPLPVRERAEVIEVPQRLARLLQEERPLPPREVSRPEEPKAMAPQQAPRLAEERAPDPGPKQGPGEGPGQGAGPRGILAFREKFSGLAEGRPGARLGSQARISSSGEGASGRPERSLVTTLAPGSSGGINLASLSRGGGGSGSGSELAGVEVARATSSIGGGGAGGGGSGAGRSVVGRPALGRTDEEIQIVFDRHKAALYRLYNRELRSDPTLKGQIVLRVKIEPDGSVSLCVLQATDMKAPQLAARVVERVRTFDFGAKEGIAAVTILYPIDFLPAT